MAKEVVVVGAGFTGLAAAALLARDGCAVTIVERCSSPGGRARLWETEGYAFDMGPSWYLMPEVFDRFFSLFDKKREDYWRLKKLDTHYQVFFGGREKVTISSDLEATKRTFEGFEARGARKLADYVANSKYKYGIAMRDFLYREYRHVFQFLNRRLMTEGLRLNVFEALDTYVRRYFSDHRARKILEYAMVFLGASPTNAPALYSLMSYLDLEQGIYFPEGGMYAIVEGLVKLGAELGVKIEYDTDVTSIVSRDGRATGIAVRRGSETATIDADAVLVCADYAHAELDLLPPAQRNQGKKYWDKAVLAPSMFIAYLGVKGSVDGLAHHNLYFADDWDDHFKKIFETPQWPDDACFYLSAASKTDARAAPPGKENLFLLVPVAPGLADTDEQREAFYQATMDRVERVIGTEIRSRVEVKRLFTQRDFAADYHAFKGTALGLAHTLRQSAVFRPGMRSKKLKGLYFAGQYTHPGVGVPMAFIAAEVVAPLVSGAPGKRRPGQMKKSFEDGGLGGYQAATFKRGSTTYFNASLFFPPVLRDRVFTLYAFVRRADDFVDSVPQNVAGFRAFRDYAEGRGSGTALTQADRGVVDAFRELSAQADFDPAWASAFLDAMEADLSRARYDTLAETLAYVYGSAEVIGLFMGRLMDLPGAADPGARLLGRAMQYINFIRDLDEDRGLGRRYLPLDGETPEIVDPDWARAHPERFSAWLRGQLDRYQAWQSAAVAAFAYIPYRYRIAIATAADMYWWTAAVIRRDPLIVFQRQVKPSRYRVFGRILFNALGGAGRGHG